MELERYILTNSTHGNEPYILATAVALEVSSRLQNEGHPAPKVIVPLVYGERQLDILKEEFPDQQDRILYDPTYGMLLREVFMDERGYGHHLSTLVEKAEDTETAVRRHFPREGIIYDARSLATNEIEPINSGNIDIAIDVGARISSDVPHKYFAFPVLLSELMTGVIWNDELPFSVDEIMLGGIPFYQRLGFSVDQMKKVRRRMQYVESGYHEIFIPEINTFPRASDFGYRPESIGNVRRTYTPPLKREIVPSSGRIPHRGVYVMYSGTGFVADENIIFEAAYDSDLDVYTQPWVSLPSYLDQDVQRMSPHIMADTSIVAIAGRSGWGTGWQALSIGKPWFVLPYMIGDDPEIFFNNTTVATTGLGRILYNVPEMYNYGMLEIMTNVITPTVLELRAKQIEMFGTLDGIAYVGERIKNDYLHRR